MEKAIKMRKTEENHWISGSVVKKAVLPSFCFAVLSTIAFEEAVHAASVTPSKIVSEAAVTKYVNISSGSLNLRAGASASSAIVTSLPKGSAVTVYAESNGWAKVAANGKEGYASSIYLSSTAVQSSTTTASVTKYVNVNSGALNLRSSASTSGKIITTLPKGTAISVYTEKNGWAKITVNGKEGYVNSSFLSSQAPTKATTGSSATVTAAPVTKYVKIDSGFLNLRKSASTNASIIIKLAKGTAVKVYSDNSGWSKIEVYGQKGYVSSSFLTTATPSTTSTTPATSTQQTYTKYVNVDKGSSLNVRKSTSTSSAVMAKLTSGDEVAVYSESNGWAKILVNGKTGYVKTQFLSAAKSSTSNTEEPVLNVKKYVNVELGSSLNMRKSASTNSSVVIKIARGVEVNVLSETNGWSKIEAYGQQGYVNSDYLSASKPGTGSSSVTNPSGETGNEPDNATNNSGENAASDGNSGGAAANSDNPSGSDISSTNTKFVNVIYGSSLNMRAAASSSSAVITKLARGTIVTVSSEDNGWAKVIVNGQTGYVSSQYLSTNEPLNPNSNSSSYEETYENYSISLNDLINIQMKASPQTDKKYSTYIRADALTLTSQNCGIVNGSGWNIRGGAGTSYWVVGKAENQESLQIVSKIKGNDGYNWYQINYNKTWVNASPEDVAYYLNPDNFLNNTVDSLQFLKLSATTSLDAAEVNNRILSGKGILQGKAAAFITAGNTYGVNEIYLISHALLETANGTSQLASGVQFNGRTVYNMYGIGAYDNSAVNSGAQFAYNAGWFTAEAAIIGGAQFIADGYINAGQDTLYKMRWNPISAITKGYASHQYATDIGWASKQVNEIYNLYSLLDSYKLVLDIPKYE